MKKRPIILKTLFLLFMLFTVRCKKEERSAVFDIEKLKEKAAEIVLMINEKSWSEIRELGTEEFKQYFTQDFIDASTKLFFKPAGRCRYIRDSFFSEITDKNTEKKTAVVIVRAKYEHKTICYTFNFTEDYKLIGFFMR